MLFERNPEADLTVLNLGTGRQSAALALMAVEGLIPRPDAMIFSDTGWERKDTLRYYERIGLVEPSRTKGNARLFSERDIERLRKAKGLMDDLGVNLAGVAVILRLSDRLAEMEEQIVYMENEIKRLKRFGII